MRPSFRRAAGNVHYTYAPGCFGPYKLLQWIGEGQSGTVYAAVPSRGAGEEGAVGADLAIKLVPLDVPIPTDDCVLDDPSTFRDCLTVSQDDFWKEVKMSREMGALGVGPAVLAAGICRQVETPHQGLIDVGYMVQPKWDQSLESYVDQFPQKFLENRRRLYQRLARRAAALDSIGLTHVDMHGNNVMVNLDADQNVEDAIFIDFEDVSRNHPVVTSMEMLISLMKDMTSRAIRQLS